MNITSAQFRAARALLGLRRVDVAERAGVHRVTIDRLENSAHERTHGHYATVVAVAAALEEAGVQFINGRGVQLRTEEERA